ncbi:hypothetical protein [Corallococcus sicarius]|uniref:Uncharacterized protein n=1 Tax=Corallococcus sicarius TaxID=2316726 RepID=A0A3A8NP23_9BACT|nr:hypothetical protein [Corallococcus sicarius]RKH42905.1 hypothetical protein D7X12_14585 [Corallococcus sicarius]
MTGPTRRTLVTNLLCLGALGWLYGGDLANALRIRAAEVSSFASPPSAPRAGVVLGLTVVALVVFAMGLLRKQPEGFKGYRLLPILLVGALFVDLVVAEGTAPLDAPERATVALQHFQEGAQRLATLEAVPSEARVLQPLVDTLGPAPYQVHGVPVGGYALQVRTGCEGPLRETSGARPGTLLYCVSRDSRQAWVTLVGLPAEVRLGAPALFSLRGEPRIAVIRPRVPEEEGVAPDGEATSIPP